MQKKVVDLTDAKRDFLSDIYQNHLSHKRHIETKLQWVLGASAVISGVILPFLSSSSNPGIFIIAFSAILAFLISLYAFEPIAFFKTNDSHNHTDVMFYKSFQYIPAEEYAKRLALIDSIDKITEQYAYDLGNMVRGSINPTKKLLKIATRILFFGTLTGVIVFFLSM
jgi:hypothetical protein